MKKEVYIPKSMTEGKRSITQGLLQGYDIESAEYPGCLKDLLSGTGQKVSRAEMDINLGYGKYEHSGNELQERYKTKVRLQ